MKSIVLTTLALFTVCCSALAQVPDSTFGEPYSFSGPNFYFPAVTGCDFDGREDRCFASLFLPDGKIMLVGYTEGSDGIDLALVRLLHDGKFDTLAGPEGQMRIDLGYPNDSCLAAVLYGQNRIVMAGCATPPGQAGLALLIARVDTEGQLDADFGISGNTVIDLPTQYEMITRVIALPDGKILIGGNAFFGDSYAFPDSTTAFVGRLLSDGQVDSTFGTNGFLYRRYEYTCKSSLLGDMIVDSQGRITLSGASYSPYPYPGNIGIDDWCSHNIHVCRYTPDGVPDTDFGENGVLELPFTEGRAIAFHIDAEDRLLLGGVVTDGLLTTPVYTFFTRFLPDGTLDSSFANNGRFMKYIFCFSASSAPVDILEIGNNYYIGVLDDVDGFHAWFGLISLTKEGALDSTFGTGGVYNSDLWLLYASYSINEIHTLGLKYIYISGYYGLLHDNMMIARVKLTGTTSVEEIGGLAHSALRLFPNPSASGGRVFFEVTGLPQDLEAVQVQVTDMQGRVVFSQRQVVSAGVNELALPIIPSGYYVVSFTGRDIRSVGKLLVR